MSVQIRSCSVALTALASAMIGGAAFAADLPIRREPAAPYVAPPVFTWTGFYVGANAGYGFGSNDGNSVPIAAGTFSSATATEGALYPGSRDRREGFVGGGQVGYNYQVGQVVFGVETDLQYAGLGHGGSNYGYSFVGTGSLPSNFTYVDTRRSIDWFGTFRGRVGYAFDRVLVYGTAGLAYGGGSAGTCLTGSCDRTGVGYAAGAGVEYAITPNWSAKVEALYVNLGRSGSGAYGYDTSGVVYSSTTTKRDDDFTVVRAGVNYRF